MRAPPKVSVVIPADGGVSHIRRVSESVRQALAPGAWSYEILFVDGAVGGVADDVAGELAAGAPVRLVMRQGDESPSSAVIRGITAAHGDFVVVMNADPSFSAECVLGMVRLLDAQDGDFVIGSRYLDGRVSGPRRGWLPRLPHRVGTWLTRPLVRLSDPRSRTFAFERERLPEAGRLSPAEDNLALELLVKGAFSRPVELPLEPSIGALDRPRGDGRSSWRERVGYLRHLRHLYQHSYPVRAEFVQFGMVGASGFVVDVAIYLGLQQAFGLHHQVARSLSFWGGASWNWACNRALTFSNRKRTRKRVQWPAFVLSSLIGFVLNCGAYYSLTTWVPFFDGPRTRLLAMLLGVLVGMGMNFVMARLFVFVPAARGEGSGVDSAATP